MSRQSDQFSKFPIINSVVSGLQEGQIYSEDFSPAIFVIHKAGFAYIKHERDIDWQKFVDFILTKKEIPQYFHLYDADASLITICAAQPENLGYKVRKRIQLRYLGKDVFNQGRFQHKEFVVEKISEQNLELLEVFNLDIGNKFWSSEDDFLNNGFGFAVFINNQPASICYTASVANSFAEIDVVTLELFRNRGLAKVAVREFTKYCIASNIIANWDCFSDNIGSLKTALSLGFTEICQYSFLSIYNKRK